MKISESYAAREITEGFNADKGIMNRDEAYTKLEEINKNFRGETYSIPLDNYDEYLKAARDYISAVEETEKISRSTASATDKIYHLAKRVVAEAPKEAEAA